MNLWDAKWDLDEAQCPCDIHFNQWIDADKITGKTIYHFGTGTHHIVGLTQAANGSGNVVFAITASIVEYDAYIKLVNERPQLLKSYLAYFGDIYLTNARLLPQRPYFPLGTLRQALTYPTPAEEVDDTSLREAMAAAGLGHLSGRLDEEAEWGTVLSGGEQQRVAFARALIARPDVLLLDEAVTTLEETDGAALYRMVTQLLPTTIIISIGRPALLAGQHHRAITLEGAPASSRRLAPAAVPVPA